MQFCDRLTIDRKYKTGDGYLRVTAKAARAGIQKYLGREVDPEGKHFAADQVVSVYRPADEVFDQAAVASFIGRPITDDHPSVPVTAKNWRDHSRGVVGGAVKDGEWIRFDLALMDADLIGKVDDGKRELSCGYGCELAIEDGKTSAGEDYQAVQRSIRGNHVAVVDRARAGSDARISDGGNKLFEHCDSAAIVLVADANPERQQMSNFILHDGLKVDLGDADAVKALVVKLQGQVTDANTARETAEKALTDAKSEHDKELGTKDAEIAKLKEQVVDAEKIDALADAKAEVVGKAKAVLGDKLPETKGKSIADVRRAAVAAKFGDEAVADKSDDYVEARFDAMTADVKPAEQQIQPLKAPGIVANDADVHSAYDDMIKDMQKASQPKHVQAA